MRRFFWISSTIKVYSHRFAPNISMDPRFQLTKLNSVFNEAIKRNEPTLIFELKNGKGRFLFMMFFDKEDASTKDHLFIFLRNTNRMLSLILYGNHSKGQFDIFITPRKQQMLIEELGLTHSDTTNSFSFGQFVSDLNNSIPDSIPLRDKVVKLREVWSDVNNHLPADVVDEHKKTILIGPMPLPKHKSPQEKTLRKLYLISSGNVDEITELIGVLKKINHTVKWTADPSVASKSVSWLLDALRN